jgi:hypothetical protein
VISHNQASASIYCHQLQPPRKITRSLNPLLCFVNSESFLFQLPTHSYPVRLVRRTHFRPLTPVGAHGLCRACSLTPIFDKEQTPLNSDEFLMDIDKRRSDKFISVNEDLQPPSSLNIGIVPQNISSSLTAYCSASTTIECPTLGDKT